MFRLQLVLFRTIHLFLSCRNILINCAQTTINLYLSMKKSALNKEHLSTLVCIGMHSKRA